MESIADRTVSALTDRMSVLQIDNERFEVASESGETYEVDLLRRRVDVPTNSIGGRKEAVNTSAGRRSRSVAQRSRRGCDATESTRYWVSGCRVPRVEYPDGTTEVYDL